MSNSSIWPIDRNLPCASSLSQRRLGRDVNERVIYIPQNSTMSLFSVNEGALHIPQNSTISLFRVIFRRLVGRGGSYLSAEMQSLYSAAAADWVNN